MKAAQTLPLDKKDALLKAEHYCAYQERSHQEVRDKLYTYELKPTEVEEIISSLIENNFLNEERFAIAYANGKLRMKGWGKIKIKHGLKIKRVSPQIIDIALRKIDGDDYIQKLRNTLERKKDLLKESNDFKLHHKLIQFALGKGYELDIITDVLKTLKNEN